MNGIVNLIQGFKSFKEKTFNKDQQSFKDLSNGQSPETLIIACSDSRVDPAIITNAKLGEIFVIRNVANIVPDNRDRKILNSTVSAIQFAVEIIKVKNIVVLGHSNCAGVKAIANSKNELEEYMKEKFGNFLIHVSLSDTKKYSIASVIIEKT